LDRENTESSVRFNEGNFQSAQLFGSHYEGVWLPQGSFGSSWPYGSCVTFQTKESIFLWLLAD